MERSAQSWSAAFSLKNGVAFIGKAGYNLYRGEDYNLNFNTYLDTIRGGWDEIKPVYYAESFNEIDFRWTNIESATALSAGVYAVWTMFF